jgi:hypothetical protein
MAKQRIEDWGLAVLREFIKAGAVAAHAALAAAVMVEGMDMWERVHAMMNFGAAAFIIKGVTGVMEYLAKDPVPFDSEGEGVEPKA